MHQQLLKERMNQLRHFVQHVVFPASLIFDMKLEKEIYESSFHFICWIEITNINTLW